MIVNMKKIPMIYQTTTSDCGLCCISMLASAYSFNQPLAFYRKQFNIGRDGISIDGICEIYKSINMDTKVLRIDDLIEYLDHQYEAPCILYLNTQHFVVAQKRGKKLIVFDPATGKSTYSLNKKDSIPYASQFAHYLIIPTPSKKFCVRKGDIGTLRHIKPYLFEFRGTLVKILFFSLLAYSISLLVPILLQNIVDTLVKSRTPAIVQFALIALGLVAFFTLFSFLKNNIITRCQVDVYNALYENAIRHLFEIPYSYYDNRSQGNILFRINVLSQFQSIISSVFPQFVVLGTSTFVILVYLSAHYPILMPLLVATSLLAILYVVISNKILLKMRNEQIHENEQLSVLNTETVQDMFQIRSMHLSKMFLNRSYESLHKFSKVTLKTDSVSLNLNQIVSYFTMFVPVFGILYLLIILPEDTLSVGELVAVYSLMGTYYSSAISFFTLFLNTSTYKSSLEYLNDFLDEESQKKDKHINPKEFKLLTFEDVSFSYNASTDYILKNVSFSVKQHEKVAIVGASGSGKTTILKLLSGLYQPVKGDIKLNGYKLDYIDDCYFSKNIAFVPQNAFILNDTILNNVTFGDKSITESDVFNALDIVNLKNDVLSMPLGLRTVISASSSNFSGGQVQRLAIARAIIRHPELLVFDESTSSLDSINEEDLYRKLAQLNITTIIVSHKLSTIKNADKILVIDGGKIVESGTHEMLMNKKGIYYNLFVHQT